MSLVLAGSREMRADTDLSVGFLLWHTDYRTSWVYLGGGCNGKAATCQHELAVPLR